MPRDIRVGDKVRLKHWADRVAGLFFVPQMQSLVGQEVEVAHVQKSDELGPAIPVDGWWWPVAALELVATAPRPSAWTKTSEGKPEVDRPVVGIWFKDMEVQRCRLAKDGRWMVDIWGVLAPDFWIDEPLPAPPEVSK